MQPDMIEATAPEGVVIWFATMSVFGEVCCPAPTLDRSAKLTNSYLRDYHRRRVAVQAQEGELDAAEGEWSPEDLVVARVERDVEVYSTGLFVAGGGATEEAAFQSWQIISSLEPREALRRWRRGFPRAKGGGQDPLTQEVARLKGERRRQQVQVQEPGLCRA